MNTLEMDAQILKAPAKGGRILESSPVHEREEASEYDDMVQRHQRLLNRPFVHLISKAMRGRKNITVLDVGTGPGWIPIELARQHPTWTIHALDASADMLERGRMHAERAGVAERIHFHKGDALDLPFEPGRFDLAVSHFMLHHLAEPEKLFNAMQRVCKPNGQVMIKDLRRQAAWKSALLMGFSKHVLRYSGEQLRMYRESLDAALTIDEVKVALRRSNLSEARVKGFRGLDFIIHSN